MAVTTRRPAPPDATELADLKAALQTIARVTANVAARNAPASWTDFQQLLTCQYNVTFADAELFREILAGRKP